MTSLARHPVARRTAWNLLLAAAALLAVAGMERALRGGEGAVPEAAAMRAVTTGEISTYDRALRRLDLEVRTDSSDAARRSGEWLFEEVLARSFLARAKLSGSYDDFAAAQAALSRAFASTSPGTGPHTTAAALAFSVHRLDETERMLDRVDRYAVPPVGADRAELLGMRGDIAFYRGDYAGAWRLYEEADRLQPGSADFRRAVFHSKTGRTDLAEQQFDSYERSRTRPTRQLQANLELQRGILDLDTGRWAEALEHFRRADAIFPGWWLVEEHIAETTALLGDKPTAEQVYRRVVERTGAPEFMDALAALLLARGAEEEAQQLRRRSRALWEERLRLFPEASYGHAFDHCAQFEDRDCALRLARSNWEARPYGEAGERLATALADAGQVGEARQVIDRVLQSRWRTPVTFAVAHRIYREQGERGRAEQFRQQAIRLHPRIFG